MLDVPFCIVDATTLTEAGYVGEDVENIVGFDEGPAPADYDQQLEKRGISIIPSFLREEGCAVLQRYVELEGVVYNPSRNS